MAYPYETSYSSFICFDMSSFLSNPCNLVCKVNNLHVTDSLSVNVKLAMWNCLENFNEIGASRPCGMLPISIIIIMFSLPYPHTRLHFLSIPYDRYSRTIPWCWYSWHQDGSYGRSDCDLVRERWYDIHWYLEEKQYKTIISFELKLCLGVLDRHTVKQCSFKLRA